MPTDAIFFAAAFLIGKLASLAAYRAAWRNGGAGAAAFLRKGAYWPAHSAFAFLAAGLDWRAMPLTHAYAIAASGALSLGAIGRTGAVDLGRFFAFERLLVASLWIGTWFSPIWLYPSVLACCCLQYTVSGSRLGPGYSNLLGFEFMRASLCMLLAGLALQALIDRFWASRIAADAWVPALVLCGQAAGYVQQAIAKSALGPRWHSWIGGNRVECLIVNAWLRGWGARIVGKEGILRIAGSLSRLRVPLCAAVWLIEIGWIAVLADRRSAIALLAATAAFHLIVWASTGLAGWHYLISHGTLLWIASRPEAAALFSPSRAALGAACIAAAAVPVLLLRRRLFRAFREGDPEPWSRFADPADHLMAWWDGPYMRMYSWVAITLEGRRFAFPATRFSPYDTFLTDIHTHLMILGRPWDRDPGLDADRARARAGVWGLLVDAEDRDRLYRLMDDPSADPAAALAPGGGAVPAAPAGPPPLLPFFRGLNAWLPRPWFRLILRWPHFPGEDHVPDVSPLASERLPAYAGQAPVAEVECRCVKSFYRAGEIRLLEDSVVDRFAVGRP